VGHGGGKRATRLRYLNISENAFEVWPEAVSCMKGLIELRATDNPLAALPDSIAGLAWPGTNGLGVASEAATARLAA